MAFPSVYELTTTVGSATRTTSWDVDMPAVVSAGDLLVMFLALSPSGATVITPSGWTLLGSDSNGSYIRGLCYVKKADGTEDGSTITVSQSTSVSATFSAHVYRIAGHNDLSGIAITYGNTAATSVNPSSLSPSWGADDTLWVLAVVTADDDQSTTSASTGYSTNLTDNAVGQGANNSARCASSYRAANTSTEDPNGWSLQSSESIVYFLVAIEPGSADVTAPILSGASGTATGTTTASGSVSTDEGNGTLYAVVTTSATAPSVAQVQAGQDHAGASAAYSTSQTVSATGTQNVSATGLTAGTTYYWHFQQEDAAANDSTVVSSASFSTPSAFVETYAATSAADLVLTDTWTLDYAETYTATSVADLALTDSWSLNYTETFAATSAADLALTNSYDSPSVAYDETFTASAVADLALTNSWSLNYTETFTATSAAGLSLADTWALDYAESFAATSVGDLTLTDSYAVGSNYVESFRANSVADLALTNSWSLNYTETFAANSAADLALINSWALNYAETFAATSVADLTLTHTYGFHYQESFTATSAADLSLTDSFTVDYAEDFVAGSLADLDLTHNFTTPSAIGRIINPTLKKSCDSRTVSSTKLIN